MLVRGLSKELVEVSTIHGRADLRGSINALGSRVQRFPTHTTQTHIGGSGRSSIAVRDALKIRLAVN
jgi:hypothetical protein